MLEMVNMHWKLILTMSPAGLISVSAILDPQMKASYFIATYSIKS